jgi:hypothetical protein
LLRKKGLVINEEEGPARACAGDIEKALELLPFAQGDKIAGLGIEIGLVAADDFASTLPADHSRIGHRFRFDGAEEIGHDDRLPFEALGFVRGQQLNRVANFLLGRIEAGRGRDEVPPRDRPA